MGQTQRAVWILKAYTISPLRKVSLRVIEQTRCESHQDFNSFFPPLCPCDSAGGFILHTKYKKENKLAAYGQTDMSQSTFPSL